ncbi:hypothetical protein BN2497_10719 [Janthinobacterium sp. CG23_2]|nr:hypothetical protein BN2497_10719 [Janthinobacterium sp. CG23_2]CUU31757.1 hypothetical protein BN3177_10719 [Janthinobacterium sp. CG23_2]
MKDSAMTWLAKEKGYLQDDLELPDELAECLERLVASNGADQVAIAVLNRIHCDSGTFIYPLKEA